MGDAGVLGADGLIGYDYSMRERNPLDTSVGVVGSPSEDRYKIVRTQANTEPRW